MDPLTYTLIVTQLISALTSPQISSTTVVVPNFATEQACRYAGAQQETAFRHLADTAPKRVIISSEFICVPNK